MEVVEDVLLIKKEYRAGNIYTYISTDNGETWKFKKVQHLNPSSEEKREEISRLQQYDECGW